MLEIAVYDTEFDNLEEFRSVISLFAIKTDMEIVVHWDTAKEEDGIRMSYIDAIQIAFISLDEPDGDVYGERLYRKNPNCLICFVGKRFPATLDFLCSRPIAFYHALPGRKGMSYLERCENPNQRLLQVFSTMVQDRAVLKNTFQYTTKKTHIRIPINNIVYFSSDLKYVTVHMVGGKCENFFCKLTEIETLLNQKGVSAVFLRIHKSYLVNILHIFRLNRAEKKIELSDATVLPVSDARYPATLNRLTLTGKYQFAQE